MEEAQLRAGDEPVGGWDEDEPSSGEDPSSRREGGDAAALKPDALADVELPSSMDEMVGFVVHKPRWGPPVRWHPVWDVPRAPRILPEATTLEPSPTSMPVRTPAAPADPPLTPGGFIGGPPRADPYMMGGPIAANLMAPHAMPFPGMAVHPGMGPAGVHPGLALPPDPYLMGDWGKGGPQRRGKGNGPQQPAMKGRGGVFGHHGPASPHSSGGKGGRSGGKGKGKGGAPPIMA
ncbi:hypothetical protein AB1Y20_001924 [Prymnesium parvum]|uniref:Uncharacterized protein n=1 Tax=Prymnesium parvum TaxID=97485 RepID=A0AB34J9N0_PRYPA